MLKKSLIFLLGVFFLASVSGCIFLAGAAGGAGTAAWLSGKLSETTNSGYDRTVNAAKKALQALKLEIAKETREEDVAQLRSKYFDGREVWVDVRRVTENSSKVEVRVGAMGDKEAADKIMRKIVQYAK